VLQYTRLKKPVGDKHSNVIDPFVSDEENELIVNATTDAVLTTFHFQRKF
jgi:hypothetical protein